MTEYTVHSRWPYNVLRVREHPHPNSPVVHTIPSHEFPETVIFVDSARNTIDCYRVVEVRINGRSVPHIRTHGAWIVQQYQGHNTLEMVLNRNRASADTMFRRARSGRIPDFGDLGGLNAAYAERELSYGENSVVSSASGGGEAAVAAFRTLPLFETRRGKHHIVERRVVLANGRRMGRDLVEALHLQIMREAPSDVRSILVYLKSVPRAVRRHKRHGYHFPDHTDEQGLVWMYKRLRGSCTRHEARFALLPIYITPPPSGESSEVSSDMLTSSSTNSVGSL